MWNSLRTSANSILPNSILWHRKSEKLIINTVASCGGHLAASLGTVELTLALHYVFNTPQDKIIWDVGHQTYAHKIITGRKEKFATLRRQNGISGFPRREESPYDVFNVGHSGTSISAAAGFAEAGEFKR
jgi:1-deoxy-D-xylulose-5-phosphate synthase